MGKIFARNVLSWLELLISRVASSWLFILFIFHYIFWRLAKQSQFIPLHNVVYFITLLFWFVKYSHFTKMMCYYLNVHFQGQRVNLHNLSSSQTNKLVKNFEYLRKEFLLYYSMSGLTMRECVAICEFVLSAYVRKKNPLVYSVAGVCCYIQKRLGVTI